MRPSAMGWMRLSVPGRVTWFVATASHLSAPAWLVLATTAAVPSPRLVAAWPCTGAATRLATSCPRGQWQPGTNVSGRSPPTGSSAPPSTPFSSTANWSFCSLTDGSSTSLPKRLQPVRRMLSTSCRFIVLRSPRQVSRFTGWHSFGLVLRHPFWHLRREASAVACALPTTSRPDVPSARDRPPGSSGGQGKRLRAIARLLDQAGIDCQGHRWSHSGIRSVLRRAGQLAECLCSFRTTLLRRSLVQPDRLWDITHSCHNG